MPKPAPPPATCSTEKHKGFDFWLGEWHTYQADGETRVGSSEIVKLSGGCVVRETWMPAKGFGGMSMSMLDAVTGRWEQTWMGPNGKRVDFTGGVTDGKMVLTGYWDDLGGPGIHGLVRMTYTRLDDGSVRQLGEASMDHGLTWQPSFDFLYKRAPLSDQ